MTEWNRMRVERLAFAGSVAIGGLIAALAGPHAVRGDHPAASPPASRPAGLPELSEPRRLARPESTGSWLAPVTVTDGPHWTLELFGAPELWVDAETRAFTMRPAGPARNGHGAIPVRVVAIHRPPFRVQLRGYVRRDERDCGIFALGPTRQPIVAGPGERLDSVLVAVRRVTPARAPSTAATAVVLDERTGREVMLDGGREVGGDEVGAELSLDDDGESTRLVRAGDQIEAGGESWRVTSIRADEGSVTLKRMADASGAAAQVVWVDGDLEPDPRRPADDDPFSP